MILALLAKITDLKVAKIDWAKLIIFVNMVLSCLMCTFHCEEMEVLVKHTVRYHRNDPRFSVQCRYEQCVSTYRSWLSFKSHVYRKHKHALPAAPDLVHIVPDEEVVIEENVNNADISMDAENQFSDIQKQYVKYIQTVREGCNVSQRATKKITEGIIQFSEDIVAVLKNIFTRAAETEPLTSERVTELFERFKPADAIQSVGTQFLMDKYLLQTGFLQLPQEQLLEQSWAWVKRPTLHLVNKPIVFYEVPFLKSVEQLLNVDDVLFCVDNPRINNDPNILRDYADGIHFKSHPIFGRNRMALQIILYYDDIEIVNPLGSKVKTHKLAMFYWSLGNIYPEHRSTLRVINLLAIVKSNLLRKYGVNKILQNFVHDIRKLESADGVTFSIHGVDRVFHGSLLLFAGDTLASNFVGGFKESCAFAKRPCRVCMGTQITIRNQFLDQCFVLRDKKTHLQHCESVNEPGLTKTAKSFWSKEFGVSNKSILCEINSFDVTKGLVQDLMHVVIEGVLELECRHFLKYCQENNLVRLKTLNENILHFDFGHLTKDRPSAIETQHLENKLRQNCAQLITLGNSLPFLIGDKIPENDERLQNLILLLQILNAMLAFEISVDEVVLVQTMIDVHHRNFVQLYPHRRPTPKFHFMTHLPAQIINFGPLRHQWCMRFEGAHCRFKHLASVVKCFKNIPYTLAYRQQSLRCAEVFTATHAHGRKILYDGDVIGRGSSKPVADHFLSVKIEQLLEIGNNTLIFIAEKVTINGTIYQEGSIILLENDLLDLPQFGKVEEVIIFQTKKYLVLKNYRTMCFHSYLNAYEVSVAVPLRFDILPVDQLIHTHPLSIFRLQGVQHVVLLNHRRSEFGSY